MTLLDYPGHVACTVFLGGCDMRCPFCHNSELVDGTAKPIMTAAELTGFLKKRQGLLEGVAVTGGEPLLREETLDLLRTIRELGYPVKLDTNGTHPERLRSVMEQDLAQYVAMDIKNSPERYAGTIGLKSFDPAPVRESVSLLMAGKADYEFRTTVVAELHGAISCRNSRTGKRFPLRDSTHRQKSRYRHGPRSCGHMPERLASGDNGEHPIVPDPVHHKILLRFKFSHSIY